MASGAVGPRQIELCVGKFFSVVGPSGCGKSTLLDGAAVAVSGHFTNARDPELERVS